ncbi:MAG: porin, partial [Candidatus Hydrogenedentes bacterium]|nr:porin [Candidatus Hydrogenedentota bacterium]
TEFRRARIYLSGLLYDNVQFKAEYNFSDGDAEFKDVYLAMSNLPVVGNVKLGHIKEPFSLEEQTSGKYLTFMERALPNALVQGRNTGVLLHDQVLEDRMTWALGFFRTADDFGNGSDDGDYAVTARITGLPWYADEGRKLLHLGVAYSHHFRNGPLRFNARPEAHLSDFSYLDTGVFETDDMELFGLEAAYKQGPFSLQGEYIRSDVTSVRRTNLDFFRFRDEDDLTFDGYYVAASYVLTGEDRPYDRKSGAFVRLKPRNNFSLKEDGGWGAFELALRFSNLDLNDGLIRGGEEDNWTAALNWYLNPHSRISMSYTRAEINRDRPGSAGRVFRRGYRGGLDVLQTRFQVDF